MQHNSQAQLASFIEELKEWVKAEDVYLDGLRRLQKPSRRKYKKYLSDHYARD